MAIRHCHKKGDYLMVDDFSGFIRYRSQLRQDEYGFWTQNPDIVNMQKYIRAFGDPYPISPVRSDADTTTSNYPTLFVGLTNVPVDRNNAGFQVLSQSVGQNNGQSDEVLDQEIGYSLTVY